MKMNKKIFAIVLIIALVMSFAGCSSNKAASKEAKSLYKAGKYTSVAKGFGGDLTVEVEFSADKIKNVTILSHSETKGVSDEAIAEIPKRIVEKQTADVDGISGASHVSKAIKDAVDGAIKEAKGEKTETAEVKDGCTHKFTQMY